MMNMTCLSVKEALAVLDQLSDAESDGESIDVAVIPLIPDPVSDEEQGGEDDLQNLEGMPPDVAGVLEVQVGSSNTREDGASLSSSEEDVPLSLMTRKRGRKPANKTNAKAHVSAPKWKKKKIPKNLLYLFWENLLGGIL